MVHEHHTFATHQHHSKEYLLSMNAPPALTLDRVSIDLDGTHVIGRYCASVDQGERVLLAGPSGSGKSTLLHSIMGFVPLVSGQCRILGQAMDAKSVWQLRRHLAMVPQEPQLGEGSVEEILLRPFSFRANAHLKSPTQRISRLLERLGLSRSTLGASVQTLSGGERQRIAIIAALLLDRDILLMDEPTSALDPDIRQAVLSTLSEEGPPTLVVVSHDEDWETWVDRSLPKPNAREGQVR